MVKRLIVHFRDVFSPVRNRNLRLYWFGQIISLIGIWMQATAQSWVVWKLTGSTVDLGTVAMLGVLPFLLLAPFTGVVADRVDRRKLLIVTQVSAMLLAFILAYLVQTNTVQLWHIFVLASLLGIVNAFDSIANQAFIGDLAGTEVRKAIIINNMIFQTSRMLGPALAGIVIASAGIAAAFWFNGATFLAVIASLIVITSHHQARTEKTGRPTEQFKEGLGFLKNSPIMLGLIFIVAITTFFVFPAMFILPAVTTEILKGDAETLGFLMASSGAGALVGALFIAPLAQKIRRTGLMLAAASVWAGVWLVVFSFSNLLQISMFALFFTSLLMPVIFTTTNGLMQIMAPPEMRARLLSIMLMVSFGAQPIASYLLGYSAHFLGIQAALRLNGIAMIACIAALLIARSDLRMWETEIDIQMGHGVPPPGKKE